MATFREFVEFHGQSEDGRVHVGGLPKDDRFDIREDYTFISKKNDGSTKGTRSSVNSFLTICMDSTEEENKLSTSTFYVENRFLADSEKSGITASPIVNMPNSGIVRRHNDFMEHAKRL